MKLLKTYWHRWRRKRHGSALLLTLGVMALLLIVVMVFAFEAQSSTSSASLYSHMTRARLMARSGTFRALGLITNELAQPGAAPLMPATRFYTPGAGSWQGLTILPTVDTDVDAYRDDTTVALQSKFVYDAAGNTVNFTPNAEIDGSVAWLKIMAVNDKSADGNFAWTAAGCDTRLVGMVAYVIVDRTGLLDPAEVGDGVARSGASMKEVNLATLMSAAYAADLSSDSWLGYGDIYRSVTDAGTALSDTIAKYIFPFSRPDAEEFWLDINDDSQAVWTTTDTEIFERQDITALTVGPQMVVDLYNFFMCGDPGRNNTRTDNTDLDDTTKSSPFIVNQKATMVESRRIALQMAMLMLDSIDRDPSDEPGGSGNYFPDVAYLEDIGGVGGTSGILDLGDVAEQPDATPRANHTTVYGIENGYGLAELNVTVSGVNNAGNLELTPSFQALVYNPWSSGGAPVIEITYTGTVLDSTFGTYTFSGTATLNAFDPVALVPTGGETRQTSAAVTTGPHTSAGWFGTYANWYLADFAITKMVVKTDTRVIRQFPISDPTQWMVWTQDVGTQLQAGDADFGVNMRAVDPMFSDRDLADVTDFWTFWQQTDPAATPGRMTAPVAAAFPSGTAVTGYDTGASYNRTERPRNTPFARVGEIGRLHSPHAPNRSVCLWKASADIGTAPYHDAYLLDMFYAGGSATGMKGRININTRSAPTLKALFTNAMPPGLTVAAATTNLQAASQAAGGLRFRGDLMNAYSSLDPDPTVTSDIDVDESITKLVELCSTRQNYFTIIATARSMRDIGSWDPANAPPDAVEYDDSSDSHAMIEAEYKIMSTVFRDAWTNEIEILRQDELED